MSNNKKIMYKALYKCEMCGQIQRYGDPVEADQDAAEKAVIKVISNQQFAGSVFYKAPMHITHRCTDGSVGISRFIGLRSY